MFMKNSLSKFFIICVLLICTACPNKYESTVAAGDANDEGTNSMMSDFITEQEKTVWMMKAWLNETI